MPTPAEPGDRPGGRRSERYDAPPADHRLLAVATVLLALPIIALVLVNTYAKKEPTLGGVPFFIWYQFLWVFLCSAFTYAAYRIVLVARPHRPMTDDGTAFVEGDGTTREEGTR